MKNTIDADAAKLAGLQIDTLQKARDGQITLEHWEWFNNLRKEVRDQLVRGEITIPDPRFEFNKEFKITVPVDYDNKTQLTGFTKNHKKEFYYFNDSLTDENFIKVTSKLIPGKTYTVKIFRIKQRVSSEDCIKLLKSQNAILTGAQGISLVYQEAKEKFPKGKFYVSFDEKENLWKDFGGNHRVPGLDHYSDGVWEFYLGLFEDVWDDDYCLVCFCD